MTIGQSLVCVMVRKPILQGQGCMFAIAVDEAVAYLTGSGISLVEELFSLFFFLNKGVSSHTPE